jgi:hypothetical protein
MNRRVTPDEKRESDRLLDRTMRDWQPRTEGPAPVLPFPPLAPRDEHPEPTSERQTDDVQPMKPRS